MNEREGRSTRWDPATEDVRLVQLVDLLCGVQQELALHLLSVIYSDPGDDDDDDRPDAA